MEEKQGGAHAVTRYIVDRNASPRADHETARGIPTTLRWKPPLSRVPAFAAECVESWLHRRFGAALMPAQPFAPSTVPHQSIYLKMRWTACGVALPPGTKEPA